MAISGMRFGRRRLMPFPAVSVASALKAGSRAQAPWVARRSCSSSQPPGVQTSVAINQMINAFRDHGHSIAQLDPLGLCRLSSDVPDDLLLQSYGFSEAQLDEPVRISNDVALARVGAVGLASDAGDLTVRQLHQRLSQIYSSSMAIESVHCKPQHMQWLYQKLEVVREAPFSAERQRTMLQTLSLAHTFEETLKVRYQSVKRFGIEGGEALVVGLNEALGLASQLGVHEVVMGMPHRGRLNVLANVMMKPVEAILHEFRGSAAGTIADETRLRKVSSCRGPGMPPGCRQP